jgi:hypothetical protein
MNTDLFFRPLTALVMLLTVGGFMLVVGLGVLGLWVVRWRRL